VSPPLALPIVFPSSFSYHTLTLHKLIPCSFSFRFPGITALHVATAQGHASCVSPPLALSIVFPSSYSRYTLTLHKLSPCSFFWFLFVNLSYHTTHTTTGERRVEKHCRRRSPSSGQKTRRGIEGEKPGRRRYREVLLPERSLIEEKSSERPSPKRVVRTSLSILHHPQHVRNVPSSIIAFQVSLLSTSPRCRATPPA